MGTHLTANYSWIIPNNAQEADAWGTLLSTAFDDIDADLKALSVIVDTLVPVTTPTPFTPNPGTTTRTVNYVVNTIADFYLITQTGLGTLCTISVQSTMSPSLAVRKTLVVTLADGASAVFQKGSGIGDLTTDLGDGAGATLLSQGDHTFQVYASRAATGSTNVIIKRSGIVSTPY